MSTMTLLDMTQSILSSLSSDEVNSISDTTESMQVAEIIKTTYYNIAARANLVNTESLFQLDDSTDITQPVLMLKPDNIDKIEWIQYYNDLDRMYKYVTILPPVQFMDMVNGFDRTADNVGNLDFEVNGEVFTFRFKTDSTPNYCMVSKNFYLIFDSYNSEIENTLQAHKTRCWGSTSAVWRMIDGYVPGLNENLFPLLLNEAKALAFFELKQASHPKAEQESRRQWNSIQKNKSLVDRPSYFDQLADFGRPGGTNSSNFKARGWR